MYNRCLATATFVKEIDDNSTASVASHTLLILESFCFLILPVALSTWNTREMQLIRYKPGPYSTII